MIDSVEPATPHTNIELQLKALDQAFRQRHVITRQLIGALHPVLNPQFIDPEMETRDGNDGRNIEPPEVVLGPLAETLRRLARAVDADTAQLTALYNALDV